MRNVKAQFITMVFGTTGAAILLAAGSATAETVVDQYLSRPLPTLSPETAIVRPSVEPPAIEPPVSEPSEALPIEEISTVAVTPLGACFSFENRESGNYERLRKALEAGKDAINIRYVECSMQSEARCKAGVSVRKTLTKLRTVWAKDLSCVERTFTGFVYKNNSGHDIEIQTISTSNPVPDDFDKVTLGATVIKLPIGSAKAFTAKSRLTYYGAHLVKSEAYENLKIIKALAASPGVHITSPMPDGEDADVVDYLYKRLQAYLKENTNPVPPLTADSRAKPFEDLGFASIDIKDAGTIDWECVREADVRMKNAALRFLSFGGDDVERFLGSFEAKDIGSPIAPHNCPNPKSKLVTTTVARPKRSE